ncbi:MAG: glycosyltransferase family 2 protein [Candidatus Levybacteria bacterium]|nr:glycosyltransferase family 2 protein [Candidatus Levybacteria bacterium]
MKKNTLTGVVIARNEEEMIGECLESLSFCDSILVVDNNSSDNTSKIAKKKGAKVVFADSHDFSRLRNFALDKMSSDYVLYLDADERVSKDLASEILSVLADKIDVGAFFIPRQNYYFGNHLWPKNERLERLFKKSALKEWRGILHESPVVVGPIGELHNPIFHYTHRNLSSMVAKTNEWSLKEAELRLQANHPPVSWWRFPRIMLSAFLQSYIKQQGYKAGYIGIIESIYQAFSMFITYAKLWELQQQKVVKE